MNDLEERLSSPQYHARWLNTLSYLENCGARLIARCEHPTMVTREILRHAAEEFRHAYYIKSLIPKIIPEGLSDYSLPNLIGGRATYQYLHRINIMISRWLKYERNLTGGDLKKVAYLLVTYAIEVRALSIYQWYEGILLASNYPISVKSILREEVHHLAEVDESLDTLADGHTMKQAAKEIESELHRQWLAACRC